MSTGKILVGVLGGIAAGAAIGILLAPDKGSETRKKIMNKRDELKQKFDDLLNTVSDKYEDTVEDADKFVTKSKSRYEDIKHTAMQ